MFDLDSQLTHLSDLGDFRLSSDALTHTYSTWERPRALVEIRSRIPREDIDAFRDLGCTIGAYTVFPRPRRADGKLHRSINQARGMHPRVRDRFDLTLECIRRHYLGIDHPLMTTLRWYRDFFALFDDFAGYVSFFLLQDLVTNDLEAVRFLVDFDDFRRTPLPSGSVDEYREYMRRSMAFINARNSRIDRYFQAE